MSSCPSCVSLFMCLNFVLNTPLSFSGFHFQSKLEQIIYNYFTVISWSSYRSVVAMLKVLDFTALCFLLFVCLVVERIEKYIFVKRCVGCELSMVMQ